MGLLAFLLNLYFAATLGIAGLSKINTPRQFETTLREQKILSAWSIRVVSKTFPWIELVIAIGVIVKVMTFLVLAIF